MRKQFSPMMVALALGGLYSSTKLLSYVCQPLDVGPVPLEPPKKYPQKHIPSPAEQEIIRKAQERRDKRAAKKAAHIAWSKQRLFRND